MAVGPKTSTSALASTTSRTGAPRSSRADRTALREVIARIGRARTKTPRIAGGAQEMTSGALSRTLVLRTWVTVNVPTSLSRLATVDEAASQARWRESVRSNHGPHWRRTIQAHRQYSSALLAERLSPTNHGSS